eukprot:1142442-Pelagomonas_calceolata.AAC.5
MADAQRRKEAGGVAQQRTSRVQEKPLAGTRGQTMVGAYCAFQKHLAIKWGAQGPRSQKLKP